MKTNLTAIVIIAVAVVAVTATIKKFKKHKKKGYLSMDYDCASYNGVDDDSAPF